MALTPPGKQGGIVKHPRKTGFYRTSQISRVVLNIPGNLARIKLPKKGVVVYLINWGVLNLPGKLGCIKPLKKTGPHSASQINWTVLNLPGKWGCIPQENCDSLLLIDPVSPQLLIHNRTRLADPQQSNPPHSTTVPTLPLNPLPTHGGPAEPQWAHQTGLQALLHGRLYIGIAGGAAL